MNLCYVLVQIRQEDSEQNLQEPKQLVSNNCHLRYFTLTAILA